MIVYRTKCFCCGSVGSLFKCSRCTTLFLVYPVDDNAVVSLTYHSYCIKLTLSHPGNTDAIRCRWTSSISWRSEANSSNYNSEYSEAASWQKLLDRGNQLDCCIPRALNVLALHSKSGSVGKQLETSGRVIEQLFCSTRCVCINTYTRASDVSTMPAEERPLNFSKG